jgi:tRNA A-37 threonylcarbamoyl transferase component Bud32/membrane-associated phospholipid phosphatase
MSDGPVSPSSAATVRRVRRQRRPSGEPPPLPHRITLSTTAWLTLVAIIVTGAFLISERTLWRRTGDHASTWLLRQLAGIRTPWLTDLANWVNDTVLSWHPLVVVALVIAIAVFRRWRHLAVLTVCAFILEFAIGAIYIGLTRPRPYGVLIIGRWDGYSAPSAPVAIVAFILAGAAYCLAAPGRPRAWAAAAGAAVLAMFCLSRLYLAVDHPDDVLFGVALGLAIPVAAFRFFTPDDVFGIAYRRGRAAHVQVTGRRGAAVRRAVRDQLGLTVLDIRPVGLASSAGSTPLRLTVEGDPDQYLFAKLYTRGHVRSDRWYKLWRTVRYGALEDEHPFSSVKQLTQYEDYLLRLLREAGVRTAAPYGIVEITPDREYLLVTEFFAGAVELGAADVDDGVIDQGLLLIRRLWDAGLAHRDIKPGNLMVRDGQLLLIDVAFAQVRPSPWRQAVDLGNMMLVLAVRSSPERVYRRALAHFTPDELAEAFAATRGVASPTQLRASLKRDPRDLLGEFRALAPPRQPIALQRWGARRVATVAAVLGVAVAAFYVAVAAFRPPVNLGSTPPVCGTGHAMILSAQAVPSSAMLPCIKALPSGWSADGADIGNGRAVFWLDSDQAGRQAVTVTLTAACNTAGAERIPSDQPGAARFERPLTLQPRYTAVRTYTVAGGCITYQFSFAVGAAPSLAIAVDEAIAFEPRSVLTDHVRQTEGLALCGRGAACPG